jgi:hypothetical protein
MNQSEIAKLLGINRSQITRYKKLGCPMDQGINAIKEWRTEHLAYVNKPLKESEDDTSLPEIPVIEDLVLPEGTDIFAARDRMRHQEMTLAATISRLEKQPETKESRLKLASLRKQYREFNMATLAYEKAIVDISAKRKELVAVENADAFVSRILAPVSQAVKGIKKYGNDDNERAILARVAKKICDEVSATSPPRSKVNRMNPDYEWEEHIMAKVKAIFSGGDIYPDILSYLESEYRCPRSDRNTRYSQETSPHFVDVLKALASGENRIVSVVGSVGSGKSELAIQWLCWVLSQAPGDFLWVSSTDQLCSDFWESRLYPVLKAIPSLEPLLPLQEDLKRKDAIVCPAMCVYGTGAHKTGLQSKGCKYICADECARKRGS